MKKLFILSLASVFLFTNGFSQTYNLSGNVYLQGTSNHQGIKVLFQQVTPGSYVDSASTNSSGNYSKTLPEGFYDVTYSKDGYLTKVLSNINLYSNQILSDTTMETAICGTMDGTLPVGTYNVGCNLVVETGKTWTLQTGTELRFTPGTGLTVNGKLEITGSTSDSLLFTSYYGSKDWSGIRINNDTGVSINHKMRIENCSDKGLYLNNCSGQISNLVTVNNKYHVETKSSVMSFYDCLFDKGSYAGLRSSSSSVNKIYSCMFKSTYYNDRSESYIYNSIFTDNTRKPISDHEGVLFISNSLFYNNGRALRLDGDKTEIYNSIIYESREIDISTYDNPTIIIKNCIIPNKSILDGHNGGLMGYISNLGVNVQVNANGDSIDPYGNIYLDPLLVDVENGDFHLTVSSPCINAGIIDTTGLSLPQLDLDEYPRIDGVINIGPYEYTYGGVTDYDLIQSNDALSVYPNPVKNILWVDLNGLDATQKYTIVIRNILGVEQKNISSAQGKISIVVSDLVEGVYSLGIYGANGLIEIINIVKE